MDPTTFTGVFELRGEPSRSADQPLAGSSFAVKDVIDVAGFRTGCGNPTYRDAHPPAVAHAPCVELLLDAGAVCVGKTTTDEFAFGLTGENAFSGSPPNPRAPGRVTGGSSCGSASAVARGLADLALGTDTGGSIRVPASHGGLWGLRPTHGRIPMAGVRPLAPSFDTVGALAAELETLRRAAGVLLGSVDVPAQPVEAVILLEEAFDLADGAVREVVEAAALELAGRLGAAVERVSIRQLDGERGAVLLEPWLQAFRTLQGAEIWSCLGSWIEARSPELGERTRANFAWARGVDRSEYRQAWTWRQRCSRALNAMLGSGRLMCIPTAPCVAPLRGAAAVDRTTGSYFPRVLALTSLSGLAGLPELSMPVGEVEGAPVGLSWAAGAGLDEWLLDAAARAWISFTSR